jgi:hypothetical protein
MDMRFGTWNVRSLYRAGSLMTVSWELARAPTEDKTGHVKDSFYEELERVFDKKIS